MANISMPHQKREVKDRVTIKYQRMAKLFLRGERQSALSVMATGSGSEMTARRDVRGTSRMVNPPASGQPTILMVKSIR